MSNGRFVKGQVPWNKNKPFMSGKDNPMYGKHHTKETIQKIIETRKKRENTYKIKSGENHWNWKGESVGYRAVHRWLVRVYGRSDICEHCGNRPGLTKNNKPKIQWANISGKYLRDRKDWKQLCISCHWKFDKRVNNFINKK